MRLVARDLHGSNVTTKRLVRHRDPYLNPYDTSYYLPQVVCPQIPILRQIHKSSNPIKMMANKTMMKPVSGCNCIGILLSIVLSSSIIFLLLLSATPPQARKHVNKLLELSKENDVCGLIQEIWPDEHSSWRWPYKRQSGDHRPSSRLDDNANSSVLPLPFACENHDIWTNDGFLLRLKRLSVPRNDSYNPKGVVLLLPGLGDSSATFVLSGKDHSLAGVLWEAQFDVWLLDVRGRAPYTHRVLTPDMDDFWDWSLDEKIEHDLPQAIDYILRLSQVNQLDAVVAHSQGALITLLALAQSPDMQRLVRHAFLFAPPLAGWDPRFAFLPSRVLFPFVHEWMPLNHLGNILYGVRLVISRACLVMPSICLQLACIAGGCGSQSKLSRERLSEIFTYYPLATSLKNIEHLLHCERSSGIVLGAHMTTKPDLKQIKTTLLSFYFGSADVLVDERRYGNGSELFAKEVVKQYKVLDYGHADFVWGENARELIYEEIVREIS